MNTWTPEQIARLALIIAREYYPQAVTDFLSVLADGYSVSKAMMQFGSGWDATGKPRATAAEMIAEARTA